MNKYNYHLLEITKCNNFISCENTPCEKIVKFQKKKIKQLPEPWNGDLENAKLLFISSNPSIDDYEYYPTLKWKDEAICDYFHNRFSKEKQYVKNYLYPKLRDGYSTNWVRYWASIQKISKKLLERDVMPGIDYALLEIVRCKSKHEYGVDEATEECTEKYLNKTLSFNKSQVLVIVGKKAREIFEKLFEIKLSLNKIIEKEIYLSKRLIFYIPHSNSRGKRTLENILDQLSIDKIRNELRIS